jgi:predicted permease
MSIAIMMALGIVLARLGWFEGRGSELIANLVTKIALPCSVLLSITNSFDYNNLMVLFHAMILPLLSIVVSYYAGLFFCGLLKVPHGRRSIFTAMFYVSNCLFIGVPTSIALFGEESTVYAYEYYVVNTTALWAVAVYQMAKEGGGVGMSIAATIKKVVFSPLIGLIVAIILILLGIQLPQLIKGPLKYIGSMTTPLSMIFVGIALNKTKLAELKINLEMLVAHLGKFIIGPFALLALAYFFPADDLQLKVLFMQSAMPVAVALPIIAATYGLDVKYAAILTSTSTLLFLGVVPVYMWLLHLYFDF